MEKIDLYLEGSDCSPVYVNWKLNLRIVGIIQFFIVRLQFFILVIPCS